MGEILQRLSQKKQKFDSLKPLPAELQNNLDEWFRVELTYSSNAIEGNTLSRIETAEVLEKGIHAVIPGKKLKEILEARNHAAAIEYVQNLAKKHRSHQFIQEGDIKGIHKIILDGIDEYGAGIYRRTDVFIRGSTAEFPPPNAIPAAMHTFIHWLQSIQEVHPVRVAADAHFRFVSIHPFIDGNGRTARLLMNLILSIHGYPMTVIRNEDRTKYLATFEAAQRKHDMQPFYTIVETAVERSLDMYIQAAQGKRPNLATIRPKEKHASSALLRIGELAKATQETVFTIRYWTQEGLLSVSQYSPGGYQLYSPGMIERVRKIKHLQNRRFTLAEIKKKLGVLTSPSRR